MRVARRRRPGRSLVVGPTAAREFEAYAFEGRLQVAVDVVAERLQRGDVDDLGRVGERPCEALANEVVDRGEKGGQRLARPSRRRDQRMPPGLDRWPGFCLRRTRSAKGALKPRRDGGMEKPGEAAILPAAVRSFPGGPSAAIASSYRGSQFPSPFWTPARAPPMFAL